MVDGFYGMSTQVGLFCRKQLYDKIIKLQTSAGVRGLKPSFGSSAVVLVGFSLSSNMFGII